MNQQTSTWWRMPRFSGPGACAQSDPEVWFRDGKGGRSSEDRFAIRICRRCKIKDECLQWAMENEDWGIWGGLTAEERRKRRRKQP